MNYLKNHPKIYVNNVYLQTFLYYQTGRLPNTDSWAISLSLSPTMLAATHTYIPPSLFRVLEMVNFPPRIWTIDPVDQDMCHTTS